MNLPASRGACMICAHWPSTSTSVGGSSCWAPAAAAALAPPSLPRARRAAQPSEGGETGAEPRLRLAEARVAINEDAGPK